MKSLPCNHRLTSLSIVTIFLILIQLPLHAQEALAELFLQIPSLAITSPEGQMAMLNWESLRDRDESQERRELWDVRLKASRPWTDEEVLTTTQLEGKGSWGPVGLEGSLSFFWGQEWRIHTQFRSSLKFFWDTREYTSTRETWEIWGRSDEIQLWNEMTQWSLSQVLRNYVEDDRSKDSTLQKVNLWKGKGAEPSRAWASLSSQEDRELMRLNEITRNLLIHLKDTEQQQRNLPPLPTFNTHDLVLPLDEQFQVILNLRKPLPHSYLPWQEAKVHEDRIQKQVQIEQLSRAPELALYGSSTWSQNWSQYNLGWEIRWPLSGNNEKNEGRNQQLRLALIVRSQEEKWGKRLLRIHQLYSQTLLRFQETQIGEARWLRLKTTQDEGAETPTLQFVQWDRYRRESQEIFHGYWVQLWTELFSLTWEGGLQIEELFSLMGLTPARKLAIAKKRISQ